MNDETNDEIGIESILQRLQRLIWLICNSKNLNLSLNDVERKAMIQLIQALTFFPEIKYPFIRVGLIVNNSEYNLIECVLRYNDEVGIWLGTHGLTHNPPGYGSDFWQEEDATWEFDEVIESNSVSRQNFESWYEEFTEGIDDPNSELTIECFDPACNKCDFVFFADVEKIKDKTFLDIENHYSQIVVEWFENNQGANIFLFDWEGNSVENPLQMSAREIKTNVDNGNWIIKRDKPNKITTAEPTPPAPRRRFKVDISDDAEAKKSQDETNELLGNSNNLK